MNIDGPIFFSFLSQRLGDNNITINKINYVSEKKDTYSLTSTMSYYFNIYFTHN